MKLIPVRGDAIVKQWGHFIEGMEKVAKYSRNDGNMESTYNDILSQRSVLWAAFRDNKYIGFVVTQIQQIPFEEPRLTVISFYTNTKLGDSEFLEGMDVLNNYAKKMNITKMEFFTVRDKGFERYLNQRKWKQKYAIFELEVI